MEFEFRRIDLFPPVELERAAGAMALLVQKRLEGAGVLSSTFVLGRKAFRLATDRLPPGHRPVELAGQDLDGGREERAARAHDRVRRSLDLVPTVTLSTSRCLVWSSPVLRPRKRAMAGLVAVIAAPSERVADAVSELWASIFLEPVLDCVPGRLRRLELAIGVTEEQPAARQALLEALGSAEVALEDVLPPPGQGPWPHPPLAFDRSVERLRAQARRSAMKRAFGTPALGHATGQLGPGLAREQVELLTSRQHGAVGAAVARDVMGPLGRTPEPTVGDERPLDLARLGAQVALHVAQMSELGREVERLAVQAQRRHDWLVEMDLQLLPDDGLRTTLEEQLGLVPAVTDLALRAALAAARLSRTYAALAGSTTERLDLGVRFPLTDFLTDFHEAARELLQAVREDGADVESALDVAVTYVAERHLEVLPRQSAMERVELRRAFEWVVRKGDAGPSPQRRLEVARVRGDEASADFESRLPRLVASRISPLRSLVWGASLLRERARHLEVLVDAMLRAVAVEVDRRLPRLEPGLPEGSVWHCHVRELVATVDLRGTSLAARVRARSRGEAGYFAARNLATPRALDFALVQSSLPLAQVRALARAVWLLLAPETVDYGGRTQDTLPSLARALDVPLSPSLGHDRTGPVSDWGQDGSGAHD